MPVVGRHRTAERASNARVRACVRLCVRDVDGSESAVAGNKAGPTPSSMVVAVNKGPASVCLVRGQPLDKLGGDGRPGAVGQKRSTDVGVPRHTPWASSKEHSAMGWG